MLTELGWSALSESGLASGGLMLLWDDKHQSAITYENMIILTTNFDDLETVPFKITVNVRATARADPEKNYEIAMKVSSFKVARIEYNMTNYRAIVVKKYDQYDN